MDTNESNISTGSVWGIAGQQTAALRH